MRSFQALALAFSLGATAGAPPSTKPVQPGPSFGVFGSAGVRF